MQNGNCRKLARALQFRGQREKAPVERSARYFLLSVAI
jgi:hypothetical protein